MSESTVFLIPTREDLQQADPEGFLLQITPERALKVSLLQVREGLPMTPDYDCYSLLIALPLGVQLPQAVFNLFGPGREQPWMLLMSPVKPEPDGRHVLEAVIHSSRAQDFSNACQRKEVSDV
ncbi:MULTISPECIES: DUF6916 family protein [Pseudomonas]|uniref:DUF6916 family protein n=1 Tax=Pseudomonas TaxID=286 RepID=UPI001E63A994|nr:MULTISPECIES: hypothetical protein [Pseudomonas]MCE1113823.1 hypothetical protein [Pseudomonas sp. NMI795_08]